MAPMGQGSSSASPLRLFKHATLLGRNLGRQRPLQQCLGMEQMLCATAGILQGNREGFQ